MQWKRTEEQEIERLRSMVRYRRVIGAVCAVLGGALGLFMGTMLHRLHTQSLAILAELDPTAVPTTQEMQRAFDQTQYNMGLWFGFMAGATLAAAASLCATGFMMLISESPRDRLLLTCWDRLEPAKGGDGTADGPAA